MKTDIIITEKSSVSRVIAQALAPDTFDERGSCEGEHEDIIALRSPKERELIKQLSDIRCVSIPNNDNYFCSSNCLSCDFRAEHVDSQGMRNARSVRKKMGYINDQRRTEDKIIFEDIRYFHVPVGDDRDVIIFDTNGTPYSFKLMRERGERYYREVHLEESIVNARGWGDIERRLRYKAGISPDPPGPPKSHKARAQLFNFLLGRELSPADGTPIEIDRIIAATDFDVAGTYIAYSVLSAVDEYIESQLKEKGIRSAGIDLDKLCRMKLPDTSRDSILDEFENPERFDWGNAYAGKIRQVFDYLYGETISRGLDYRREYFGIRKRSKGEREFSVGRNRFLSLSELIKKEEELETEEPRDYVYLLVEGLVDLKGMEDALNDGSYSAIQIKQRKCNVTHSGMLKAMKESKIGTHSTRKGIMDTLKYLGHAESDGINVNPTAFGMYYFEKMKGLLDSDAFSIAQWNDLLHLTMESFEERYGDSKGDYRESAEQGFRDFMSYFFREFKKHILELRGYYNPVVKDLVKEKNIQKLAMERRRKEMEEEERTLYEGRIVLKGRNSVITLDDIGGFMDTKKNRPLPLRSAVSKVVRVIPPEPSGVEDIIRRLCSIEREYEFSVMNAYNMNTLLGANHEDFTVFRAEIGPGYDFGVMIKDGPHIDSYEEMDITLPEKKESAHEPLEIIDLKLSDIYGREGLILVEEYSRPGRLTADKIRKDADELVNLAAFNSGDLSFERHEWYEFGKVHNYESLLIAALEKYGMPFNRTSKMMEDLYLNVH